jgi:hypothetical protein
MAVDPPIPGAVSALRGQLLEADDRKIRRVLAVVDGVSDPAVNQALLDPLRLRLASLKPVRPLRFSRLLFIPLDPLLVPARGWRQREPTVPRSVLTPIARTVRAGLGGVAPYIDKIVAGGEADVTLAITQAGDVLWPRAAEILDQAPPPEDWPETGLPLAAYRPLAASIAAVFRRAAQLRRLARSEEIGALETDDEAVDNILRNITNEPETGCAMIARLILVRAPHAAAALRRIVASARSQDEKTVMRQAMDRGMEGVLSHMEQDTGFVDGVGHATLSDVGEEVRRVTTLLREIEGDPEFARHWRRLKAIREKLDETCRERFARGINEGLVAPLSALDAPLDAAGQSELESRARDLRKLDAVARKIGGAADYDRQLRLASNAARTAAEAGTLTPMRRLRLVEILEGPEAAAALYNKGG